MKKQPAIRRIVLFILVIGCFMLIGCGNSSANKKSGEIVSVRRYENRIQIELKCNDEKHYAFRMNEDTEFVWEEECILEQYKEEMADFNEQMKEMGLGEEEQIEEKDLLDAHLYATIEFGEKTGDKSYLQDGYLREVYVAEKITVTGASDEYRCGLFIEAAKPVIYLYPETKTPVSIELDYAGELTCTYPQYNDGWEVIAAPDGTLTDGNGQSYNYLYWEGVSSTEYDFSKGYCVAGEDTAEFLEDSLEKLGLNRREANEFIVYWLPLMQDNRYNVISFQTDVYTETAKLCINPEPDTLIRVFMAWKESDTYVKILPQKLEAPERAGFTVVEWGGAEIP